MSSKKNKVVVLGGHKIGAGDTFRLLTPKEIWKLSLELGEKNANLIKKFSAVPLVVSRVERAPGGHGVVHSEFQGEAFSVISGLVRPTSG